MHLLQLKYSSHGGHASGLESVTDWKRNTIPIPKCFINNFWIKKYVCDIVQVKEKVYSVFKCTSNKGFKYGLFTSLLCAFPFRIYFRWQLQTESVCTQMVALDLDTLCYAELPKRRCRNCVFDSGPSGKYFLIT